MKAVMSMFVIFSVFSSGGVVLAETCGGCTGDSYCRTITNDHVCIESDCTWVSYPCDSKNPQSVEVVIQQLNQK